MDNNIRRRLTKKDILTIPNLLSVVRILLIPVIVVLYCVYEQHLAAVGVILLSAITDIVDGKIARRFNMISDFGKFLDPVADKLTQAALMLCLFSNYPAMLILFLLMAVREAVQFFCGLAVLKATDNMDSAQWYGKASTVIVYAVMVALFLFPSIPLPVAYILMAVCALVIAGSMILYARFYCRTLKALRQPK